MHVRPARVEAREPLPALWERPVRATHHFLTNPDVLSLRPFVAEALASDAVEWWVRVSAPETRMGFLGYASHTIEALFIDPQHTGQGGGRLLVAHAQALAAGELAVGVKEQNEAAERFYSALGFVVVGRSPTDSGGRPFPLLHRKRSAPGPPGAV